KPVRPPLTTCPNHGTRSPSAFLGAHGGRAGQERTRLAGQRAGPEGGEDRSGLAGGRLGFGWAAKGGETSRLSQQREAALEHVPQRAPRLLGPAEPLQRGPVVPV